MKRMYLVVILIFIININLSARDVFLIDNPQSETNNQIRGFLYNAIGFANTIANRTLLVGGNLSVRLMDIGSLNGDNLYIITHGWTNYFSFNNVPYNGISDRAVIGRLFIPGNIISSTNITIYFVSCFSEATQQGQNSIVQQFRDVLGTNNNNSVIGYTNFVNMGSDVFLTFQTGITNDVAISNFVFSPQNSFIWSFNPPANSNEPINQRTVLQQLLNDNFGIRNVTVTNIIYRGIQNNRDISNFEYPSCSLDPISCGCVTYESIFTPCPECNISGSEHITINTNTNEYLSTFSNGYWTISNYNNTQASIVSSNSINAIISAGDVGGHFVLYYNSQDTCGTTICSKHVYVDSPYPVEFELFTSKIIQRNVFLNWTTASEENNSGFDIERFQNNEWEKIGFVRGNGTTTSPNNYIYEDKNLSSGKYKYRLKQVDYNGNFKYYDLMNEVNIGTPDKFSLSQNYPNPFNPVTKINYDIPNDGLVSITVYDNNGREVKTIVNEFRPAGYYTAEFDGSNLSSGIYFYRLVAGNFIAVKKMMLIK